MSSGKDLQEMEAGTKQSQTAVNSGAKSGDPMPKMADPGTQLGSVEDLGGPTPDNYKSDDDSAKLKEPSLKTVADVVKKGAKPAEAMASVKKEETEAESEEVVAEEETTEEEVVSEEETTEEEVVAEEETVEEEVVAEEEETEEDYNVEEDVNALLQGEELSEEFQEKARTIFESALRSKVSEIQESLEVQYEAKLVEEVEEIKTALTERVDSYLEYVSTEWMSENRLSVEAGLKEELNNSFMSGLKNLFEEHYVSIPEDKYDVLESMVEKLDEMESKLNEQIERNVALNKRLAESATDVVFADVTEGLALSQKEKLATLAENVEFVSEEDYREKLVTLKESYFPSNVVTQRNTQDYIAEETDFTEGSVSGSMDMYLKTLERVSKK